MIINITGRDVVVGDEIKELAEEKLQGLEHLWTGEGEAHLVVESERGGYLLEIHFRSGRFQASSQARHRTLSVAVNQAVKKLELQLKKLRAKTTQRRKTKPVVPYGPEDIPQDIPLLVRVPDARIEVLDERSASLRMRERTFPFFLYRAAENNRLCIIFHKGGGDLGLMEIPED